MAISSEEACNAVRQRRRGEEQPLRILEPGAEQERTHHRDPSREAVRSDPATVREGPGGPELGSPRRAAPARSLGGRGRCPLRLSIGVRRSWWSKSHSRTSRGRSAGQPSWSAPYSFIALSPKCTIV